MGLADSFSPPSEERWSSPGQAAIPKLAAVVARNLEQVEQRIEMTADCRLRSVRAVLFASWSDAEEGQCCARRAARDGTYPLQSAKLQARIVAYRLYCPEAGMWELKVSSAREAIGTPASFVTLSRLV